MLMKYLSVEDARKRAGLRLVLTSGVPGPWGEAAKAVLKSRNVNYLPVEQRAMEPNEELLDWTGCRNAPIACLDEEPPLTSWLEILLLAERIGSGHSLLPAEMSDRALCLGFSTEIAGVDGLGWNRRQQMMASYLQDTPPDNLRSAIKQYGITADAIARSSHRIATILGGLSRRLRQQELAGSEYFIGSALSALDIYWACFSMMLRPLQQEVNPMPDWLRPLYSDCDEIVEAAIDQLLIAHRDRIYKDHIGLPLDY